MATPPALPKSATAFLGRSLSYNVLANTFKCTEQVSPTLDRLPQCYPFRHMRALQLAPSTPRCNNARLSTGHGSRRLLALYLLQGKCVPGCSLPTTLIARLTRLHVTISTTNGTRSDGTPFFKRDIESSFT